MREKLADWIEIQLQIAADKEAMLLGNAAIQGWDTQMNYWIGRRDLLWEIQRLLQDETLS